jgi:hypothetical protein
LSRVLLEKLIVHSASQEIPCLLWNEKALLCLTVKIEYYPLFEQKIVFIFNKGWGYSLKQIFNFDEMGCFGNYV